MNVTYYTVVSNGTHFLCSHFENSIDIYKEGVGEVQQHVRTVFDFGGKRLAIHKEQDIFCAAGYDTGIAAYRVSDGTELWMKKLKKIQTICFSGNFVFAHTENGKFYVLSAKNGTEFSIEANVDELFASDQPSHVMKTPTGMKVVFMEGSVLKIKDIPLVKIKKSFHSAYLVGDQVFILHLHESLASFSLEGNFLWYSDLPPGYIVNSVFQGSHPGILYCFCALDVAISMENSIVILDANSGVVQKKVTLANNVVDVARGENKGIICSNGTILDLDTGEISGYFGSSAEEK